MTVFLRLALLNTLVGIAVIAGLITFSGNVHPAGKIMGASVLCVYAAASAYCGRCAWSGGGDMRHVDLAIRLCPMLALLGTTAGFLIAFSGGVEDVQERVLGASTGLAATFIGISASILLMLQRHMLDAR